MSVRPTKQMLVRTVIVMVCMILCITIISGSSLVNIMIFRGEELQNMASEQQLYDSIVTAPRGDIYDRNMNVLATSSTAWTVYITPNGINKLDEDEAEKIRKLIADNLSEILELDRDELYEKTKQKTYYVTVKKKVEKVAADKVREFVADNSDIKMTQYIGIDETTKRYYPNDSLASTVLGFVGDDNQGLAGLESYYDNSLTGVAGRVVAAKNASGTDMPFTYQKVEEAVQGHSLVTSLDSYIQYVCEKYLDEAVEAEKVQERGAVVVMNVNTGAIYGMAVSNDFDPNSPFTLSKEDQATVDAIENKEEKAKKRTELLNRQWRNKAVSDTYEPGSVFKIFTASVALEENLVNANSTFTCNYTYSVSGNIYHCHKAGGHGTQQLRNTIANSCNPAFIMIGQLIGSSTFSKYFEAFGLTQKTGIDLPGEATSNYHKQDKMGTTELASSSFGQTFNITPLQTLALAAASVNGGYLVKPHVVEKIIDADNKVVETTDTSYERQVISESTSATMRELLEFVVENGAKNGKVAGYRVGGKTGTSEKVSKMLELNVRGLYIGSYVGIAPIDNPEIAVFVMLDETMGDSYYGGAVAAPVGSKVMAEILPYLGYEPKYSEAELAKLSVTVPDTVGMTVADAKSKIASAGLSYRVVGVGEKVTAQTPSAASTVYKNGTVILYTEGTSEETTVVPNLTGLTATEANTAAAAAGINIEFSGNTTSSGLKSYSQSIAAGEVVNKGTVVTVNFREEAEADIATQTQ
ncbi:MAG: PASTA domain-containing protein [Clostridia bacterium]|nr:PASTA domain-containing protein [Clostridia bacterium]